MTAGNGVEIVEVRDARTRREWLRVPYRIFAQDTHWVAPLILEEKQRISPRHNPFFGFGEAAFFVARRNGVPIGRISAQVNRRYLEHHRDDTGHFGFFDCMDDPAGAKALIMAGAAWLARRGLKRMAGPFNLTINEELGLLVSGFEAPPTILSTHAAPWSAALMEHAGLGKVMDLFAYRMRPSETPALIRRLANLARESGRVQLRSFDMRNYNAEIRLVFDIFNDAWSENWGFVPVSEAEVDGLAKGTRPFMRSKFGRFLSIDGTPAAMMVVLPDLNSVIAPFAGRLLPFNWARLAWSIWRDKWKSARIVLLGIRKEHRATPLAAGALSLLVSEFLALARDYELDWVEFSWVLETNRPMVALAEMAAGEPAKVYRIYGKPI